MARPQKQGIDYFSLDVQFLSDIKIRKIMRSCGSASIAILLSLLSSIYREEGYYVGWDRDLPFLVADEVGASEGAVIEVVNKALQVDFFNQDMYEKYQILTSQSIQSRFIKACVRRNNVYINPTYDLVNVDNNEVNVDINSKNVISNRQSKVKKSKVKKSKVNNHDVDNTKQTLKTYKALEFWQQNINISENSYILESLVHWIKDFGDDEKADELVVFAIQTMLETANKPVYKYLDTMLKNWEKCGLKTVEDVKTYLAQQNQNRQSQKTGYISRAKPKVISMTESEKSALNDDDVPADEGEWKSILSGLR